MGVINGVQTFAPAMIEQGTPGAIINTGSKQGITTPPDTAYNVSKAEVKVLTEAVAHQLRNFDGCQMRKAHSLGCRRSDQEPFSLVSLASRFYERLQPVHDGVAVLARLRSLARLAEQQKGAIGGRGR